MNSLALQTCLCSPQKNVFPSMTFMTGWRLCGWHPHIFWDNSFYAQYFIEQNQVSVSSFLCELFSYHLSRADDEVWKEIFLPFLLMRIWQRREEPRDCTEFSRAGERKYSLPWCDREMARRQPAVCIVNRYQGRHHLVEMILMYRRYQLVEVVTACGVRADLWKWNHPMAVVPTCVCGILWVLPTCDGGTNL